MDCFYRRLGLTTFYSSEATKAINESQQPLYKEAFLNERAKPADKEGKEKERRNGKPWEKVHLFPTSPLLQTPRKGIS